MNFFSELRLKNVSQLGQVRQAYLETSGEVSVFYYEEEYTRFGLPILPKEYEQRTEIVDNAGKYACTFCGFVEDLPVTESHTCPICNKPGFWQRAVNVSDDGYLLINHKPAGMFIQLR